MILTQENRFKEILGSGRFDKIFVLTDFGVDGTALPYVFKKLPDLCDSPVITIEAGDVNKNLDSLAEVWARLVEKGATRRSLLVNVGGGMVTDLGGFAAATFKRGIPCVNVPTTLLAMVDASTGGKTGINFKGLKNEIGLFSEPEGVIIFPGVLRSLPHAEFLSGFAEMLKTGLIADSALYTYLICFDLNEGYMPVIDKLIYRCIEIKKIVTEIDPEERGLRKILNYGHTAGHAFESLAMKRGAGVPHGIVIAWGLVTETVLSHLKLGYPSETLYNLAKFVKRYYPLFPYGCDDYDDLIELMRHDKKNRTSSEINFTLLSPLPVRYDSTGSMVDDKSSTGSSDKLDYSHVPADSHHPSFEANKRADVSGCLGLRIAARIDMPLPDSEIRTALDITRDLLQ